jgi:hypothetical protein
MQLTSAHFGEFFSHFGHLPHRATSSGAPLGMFSTSKKNVTLVFLHDNTVSSVESSGTVDWIAHDTTNDTTRHTHSPHMCDVYKGLSGVVTLMQAEMASTN